MNQKVITSIVVSLFIFSCSTTKFTKTNNNTFQLLDQNTKVSFFTQNDSIPVNSIKVGEFTHLEDKNLTWQFMRDKITQNALQNGADIIKIDKYYVGAVHTDGHSAKITGKYYKNNSLSDNEKLAESKKGNVDKNGYIFLFRYEGAAFLRSSFPIQVFLDGKEIGELPNNSYYELKIDSFGEHTLSTSSNGSNTISINIEQNQSYFIKATQNMNSANIGVNIGNKSFQIFEYLEGKLNFENVKNEGKRNN